MRRPSDGVAAQPGLVDEREGLALPALFAFGASERCCLETLIAEENGRRKCLMRAVLEKLAFRQWVGNDTRIVTHDG